MASKKAKEKAKKVMEVLEELYPFDGTCFLDYDLAYPWQLLFATILSAQCTDAMVNKVTPILFNKYPTLEDFATANIGEIADIIRPTGFAQTKAKHLHQAATQLLSNFDGQLPGDIDKLVTLSGVGRKTANVALSHIFKIPSIAVDTHVMRLSQKLGLTKNTDPVKIEFDLMAVLPRELWTRYNQQIISHGRAVCTARNPKCLGCRLAEWCLAK